MLSIIYCVIIFAIKTTKINVDYCDHSPKRANGKIGNI